MDASLNFIFPLALLIIGMLMIVAELLIGLDSLFDLTLSGGSLAIAGGVGILTNSWIVAAVLALILIALYWTIGRSYIHRMIKTHPRKTNSDKMEGLVTKITRVSENGQPFTKIEGEEWRVEVENDEEVNENDKVKVIAVKGVSLIVNKE